MNLRTTLVLLVLVAAGAVFFRLVWTDSPWLPRPVALPQGVVGGTFQTLQKELTADKLNRIEIDHGGSRVVLERKGSDWTSPGKWPTRKPEVEALVRLLTNLQSRFVPIALNGRDELKRYGLDHPPVVVTVRVAGKDHRLLFGEEPGETNRFSRATYVCLDDDAHRTPEVVRLAPGLVAALDRPPDFFQQRRLFSAERLAGSREGESQEKTERLLAKDVAAEGPAAKYMLARAGDEWELCQPVRDRIDPDKLKIVLAAIPDIWVEQFVDRPKKDQAECGLSKPEQILRVTKPNGEQINLDIGKQSQMKTRTVMRPAPNVGGPPMPPQQEVIHEEYRFAKLEGNDQIFEIKADKLKDIFVAADTLRDANLARFRSEDVRRVEMRQAGGDIVLVKEKDDWKLNKPIKADAESSKITELLDKLSGLQAREKDVLDGADPKAYGLDKPAATVNVTVEEESKDKGAAKSKKTRVFTFAIGKHDTAKSKLYVRVEGWERINAVEDAVWKLVDRPALAYRGRRVLDVASTDIGKIEVHRAGGPFTLEQIKGSWRLTAPVQAEVDTSKAGQLAGDLGRLEAVEYVSEMATPDALDHLYGLGGAALRAKLVATDPKKPAQTLLVGKQRTGKAEYFAKLTSSPGVFVVKKEIHDALDQDSLALLPLQLWQKTPEDIKEIRVAKGADRYSLTRDGENWRVTGPFDAKAVPETVRPMADELANVRCERYEAHKAKDLATYGLDKPYLRVTLLAEEKPKGKDQAKKNDATKARKEEALLIGKPADNEGKGRFAKLGEGEAIFVVPQKVVSALDHAALDLLDRSLLALDSATIDSIHSTGPGGKLTLQRKGDIWQVLDSPAATFPADSEAMGEVLGIWSNLRAERFAAYGTKLDLTAYGLDKPFVTATIALKPKSGSDKTSKPVQHTLLLGKQVNGAAGGRFARLDDGPGIVVLTPAAVRDLTRTYLDYVNRSLLKLDGANVTGLRRHMGKENLELVKRDQSWHLIKPVELQADGPTLDGLIGQLATLRAKSVAAYPVKDLKAFGLDNPFATVTLLSAGAKPAEAGEHLIKIGKTVENAQPGGDRFAVVDKSTAVVVLPGSLLETLTATPLHLRDRNLAQFAEADRAMLEHGPRKVTFAKLDGTWKMVEPLEADAEQSDLDDLVKAVAHLRADELVAEKPADLKTYGLDRPVARWRFQSGGKEVLDLIIGESAKPAQKEKKPESRRYAKLANGELVFLLSPELTGKVLGEYRSRNLWSSLDAVQIEKLRYDYLRNPFVLEKVDNDWRIAGQGTSKVKSETMREVLDALAGLRAERFVTDKTTDFKLYGLEPPQLTLQIQTSSGKRVLEIGRPEGESKRYYARLPSGDRSAVFVIAEADASRIVRPLSAFLKETISAAR
jgi:hypothetical protein